MKYIEEPGNLFEVDDEYYLAHCISSDIKLGKGIAVDFERMFNLREKLLTYSEEDRRYPTCILVEKVFNLITKYNFYDKPTCQTLSKSLMIMKNIAVKNNIEKIAMPKIGSGLDRLSWHRVSEIIQEVFKDTEIEILVRTGGDNV